MKQYLILFASLLVFSMTACKKEKLTNAQQHDVTSVTGPATGNVNTDVTFTVTYPYTNGCDYIGSFEESKNGNVVNIKAYSKPVAKDAVCTQDVGSRTVEYKFRSATAGTFELRFMKLDGSAVSHTITIQ
jgi:hypothetical protein